jgi:hypothetical protein
MADTIPFNISLIESLRLHGSCSHNHALSDAFASGKPRGLRMIKPSDASRGEESTR